MRPVSCKGSGLLLDVFIILPQAPIRPHQQPTADPAHVPLTGAPPLPATPPHIGAPGPSEAEGFSRSRGAHWGRRGATPPPAPAARQPADRDRRGKGARETKVGVRHAADWGPVARTWAVKLLVGSKGGGPERWRAPGRRGAFAG